MKGSECHATMWPVCAVPSTGGYEAKWWRVMVCFFAFTLCAQFHRPVTIRHNGDEWWYTFCICPLVYPPSLNQFWSWAPSPALVLLHLDNALACERIPRFGLEMMDWPRSEMCHGPWDAMNKYLLASSPTWPSLSYCTDYRLQLILLYRVLFCPQSHRPDRILSGGLLPGWMPRWPTGSKQSLC